MSNSAEIAALLRGAAAAGLGDGRPHQIRDPGDAIGFMLARVAATVLRRRLTFSFDTGTVLHAEAAGRRLIRLLEPPPAKLPTNLRPAFGKALTPDNAADVAAVAQAAIAAASSVTVTTAPIEGDADPTETGLSTRVLAKALGIAQQTPDDADQVAAFLEQAGDDIICALRVSGAEAEALWGSHDALTDLSERAAPVLELLLDGDSPTGQALARGGLLCLGGKEGAALVACSNRAGYVLALVQDEATARVADLWVSASR